MGKPRKHENSKDSKATLGVCDDSDKGKKEGDGALDLRSENGRLIDRLLRKTTHIHARTRTHAHAHACAAGKLLHGSSETVRHRGCLANRRLPKPCLPFLIQIRLRRHPDISFLKQVFLSDSLGQERVKGSFRVFCFSINSLNSISQIRQLQGGETLQGSDRSITSIDYSRRTGGASRG